MVKVVCWNIAKNREPWYWLEQMAKKGEADVALLQEAGSPPGDLIGMVEYDDQVFWNRQLYDRWPLVVRLSSHVKVEPFQQVPPISELAGCRTFRLTG